MFKNGNSFKSITNIILVITSLIIMYLIIPARADIEENTTKITEHEVKIAVEVATNSSRYENILHRLDAIDKKLEKMQ